MTLSQSLGWMKTLRERHQELVGLRNANSHREERLFGDKQTVKREPVYDVKKLDRLVNRVAMEIRKLDEAIKDMNTNTELKGFKKDDSVLGQVD